MYAHFGDYSKLAEMLGLDVSTISHWVRYNPRNMMRFIPEIKKMTNLSADEIVDQILIRENEIAEDQS